MALWAKDCDIMSTWAMLLAIHSHIAKVVHDFRFSVQLAKYVVAYALNITVDVLVHEALYHLLHKMSP